MIASELAQQCNMQSAKYDLAIYNGKLGVVTPNFLKKGEIINSGKKYLEDAADIAKQNNLNISFAVNSIDNILMAISIKESIGSDLLEVFLLRLIELWCFDLAIMESDRNSTNWGIIKTYDNVKLSPVYDCSNMAKLNTNINDNIMYLRSENHLANIVDSIGYSLKYDNESKTNFYIDFEKLCISYPDIVDDILHRLNSMSVDKAISDIEKRINKDLTKPNFEIPSVVGIWLNKLIKYRLTSMNCIYNNVTNKNKVKIK